MEKSEIRKKIIVKLSKLSSLEREKYTLRLVNKLMSMSVIQKADSVGITISHFPELDTHLMIEKLWQQNKQIVCPKVAPNHRMNFIKIDENTKFNLSNFGIVEPELIKNKINNSPDIIIVPGIGFSLTQHQRVGFGGGYYDRFLRFYKGQTIAAALPIQIIPNDIMVNFDKNDVPINQIIY